MLGTTPVRRSRLSSLVETTRGTQQRPEKGTTPVEDSTGDYSEWRSEVRDTADTRQMDHLIPPPLPHTEGSGPVASVTSREDVENLRAGPLTVGCTTLL